MAAAWASDGAAAWQMMCACAIIFYDANARHVEYVIAGVFGGGGGKPELNAHENVTCIACCIDGTGGSRRPICRRHAPASSGSSGSDASMKCKKKRYLSLFFGHMCGR